MLQFNLLQSLSGGDFDQLKPALRDDRHRFLFFRKVHTKGRHSLVVIRIFKFSYLLAGKRVPKSNGTIVCTSNNSRAIR